MHAISRELSNGSILHKRLHRRYDIGEYEIYYYRDTEDAPTAARHYRVCSPENEPRVVQLSLPQSYLASVLTCLSSALLLAHILVYSRYARLSLVAV